MINSKLAGLVAIASLFVAGCASDVKLDDSKNAQVETRSPVTNNANSKPVTDSPVASVDLTKGNNADNASGRIVYFDYDSYIVKDEYRSVIEAQAKTLTANKAKKVTVEGHTDERGGSEYNLALGQKRAQAVVKSLTLLGATESQVEAVSFGKERPAVQGSDEAAYAKNRRAELVSR
jgi:peptidoglycan-associated lipoprotein